MKAFVSHSRVSSHRPGQSLESLEEMIFGTASNLLADVGLGIGDIDSIVLSGNDQAEGRIINGMVTSGPLGGVGKDVTVVSSSSEHAFAYGVMQIQAEQSDAVLVASWAKPSEALFPEHADLVQAEPFIMRPVGINYSTVAGLQASAYFSRYPEQAGNVDAFVALRKGPEAVAKQREYTCWPVKQGDLSENYDEVVLFLLVSEAHRTRVPLVAEIEVLSWAIDNYDLGSRDLLTCPSISYAATQAFQKAKISNAGAQLDYLSVQESSPVSAFIAVEELGLAQRGRGAEYLLSPDCKVNNRGSTLQTQAGHCAGLLTLHYAAEYLHRPESVMAGPERVAAVTAHGFAGQGSLVAVFSSVE